MNTVSAFTSPSGDELVILSRAEFEKLLGAAEDAIDVLAYDRVKQALLSGEEECLPSEAVDRMIAGESPLRVWRRHRGMTMAQLAADSGLSEGYISQIETGRREGRIDSFKKIAEALKVTVDDLI